MMKSRAEALRAYFFFFFSSLLLMAMHFLVYREVRMVLKEQSGAHSGVHLFGICSLTAVQ